MNEKILLNKNRGKESTNINNSLAVQFVGSKRILPCDPMETVVNEVDVYNEERKNCSKIRLTVQVNPICSNVLFNNITEVVKNEGSEYTKCLNFKTLEDISNELKDLTDERYKWNGETVKFKDISGFSTVIESIRDTQLNNSVNGFKYYCGLDIFNNHYLRSNTFKTVCPLEEGHTHNYFNTLFDMMRGYNGNPVKDYANDKKNNFRVAKNLHLYLSEEILSYKETVSKKLIEKNGWFGFTNVGKMRIYDDINNDDYDWFQVINNRKSCDFIDMYPNRELFFFDPIYNSNRQRIEKNWNYCITYPSSSTTDVPFIKEYANKTSGLKVTYFDDTIKHKNGTNAIKIWSVSMHGLTKDNLINVYRGDECVIKEARVIDVIDNYTFYIFSNGIKLSEKWVELPDMVGETVTVDGETYTVSSDRLTLTKDGRTYFIINYKKANVDDKAQDISFKRVVDNNEVSYYVRIFSKLPNWKFADKKPTEYLLAINEKDKNKGINIKDYQTTANDFDSHIGKLAFSKNIYTDNISQIVFTDDIDISVLKDNLGRPLSELYLTIIKNNAGYREWYGKNVGQTGAIHNVADEKVEYSHCFGKVNCAFKLAKESIPNKNYNNVLMINNIDNMYDRNGLDMTFINDRNEPLIEDDEIQYMPYGVYTGDSSFYGDLCCYSESLCEEQSIQMIDFRFNTAQRELTNSFSTHTLFDAITYDEIGSDDFDDNDFKERTYKFPQAASRREGYYYKPHYQIPIKTYDKNITTIFPRFLSVSKLTVDSSGTYNIVTLDNHMLGENSIITIYEKKHKIYYYAKVLSIENSHSINIKVYSDELMETEVLINVNNRKEMKFFIKGEDIPSYAKLMTDGSCRYIYRELHQNGYDNDSDIEEYPFTNGSLYINKSLNLYLRRQNSDGTSDLRSKTYPYDIVNSSISFEKKNKYYHELEIEC